MAEFDRSAFIVKFQEEATDLLQRLNEGIIRLESEPADRALIDQVLRDAHTLKGSSRMVGLILISDIAHRMEDIMVRIRDGDLHYEPEMSDAMFEALDTVRFLAEHATADDVAQGQAEGIDIPDALVAQVDVPALLARLREVAEGRGGGAVDRSAVRGLPGAASEGAAAELVSLEEILEGDGQQPTDNLRSHAQATIRVKTDQVDRLLNLVNEVVIGQIKAEHRVRALRTAASAATDAQRLWAQMKATLEAVPTDGQAAALEDAHLLDEAIARERETLLRLARQYAEEASRTSSVVADLQEHAMGLRLLPVSTVFNGFPRAVRDLAREHHKEVDLVVDGGDTELDRKVLEAISDPLVHIVRNAVDHGIETPAERLAVGKPEKGTIRLAARQEGDRIVIEIADDGVGIDPASVRATAVRKGYITDAEAAALSDREATYLIFEKGFSTASIITEISGRGVGMDVVREFIVARLKGDVDVESQPGVGSVFRLTIPLTLAVIRALLVRVGGQTFALPTAAIEETLRARSSDILRVEGRDVIRRGRRSVPLVRLCDVLAVDGEPPDDDAVSIASLGFSGHRLGLVVDALAGEQQIVIKTLGAHLRRVRNIAGVTVLGTGEVVPILNVPDVMEDGRRLSCVHRAPAERAASAPRRPRRVLVCEDSFTTRELERSIFEAAGYEVETAVDGAAGLALLRGGLRVDAVLTDVQMPNMTGFELTREIKADELLRDLPVVIVTSLERDEEKVEGIEAGADAYITKSVFNQDTLLDTVERLVR